MDKNEHIEKWVQDTLNSFDNSKRATPKPYLFTRLSAKMQPVENSPWDAVLRFISKPAIAIVCTCLVVGINALVVVHNNSMNQSAADETYTDDPYTTSVSLLTDFENTEP